MILDIGYWMILDDMMVSTDCSGLVGPILNDLSLCCMSAPIDDPLHTFDSTTRSLRSIHIPPDIMACPTLLMI